MDEKQHPLPLIIDHQSKNCFFVPSAFYEKLSKQSAMPHEISFGSRSVSCQVISHSQTVEKWRLSANLWESLSIPFETTVHVFQDDGMLHIGPLIGVFTAGFTSHLHRPLGERSLLFAKYLASAANIGGYAFLFGSHEIDWETGKLSGLFYTDEGWKKHNIPFPHVVYDRIPNRRAEQLPICQDVKTRMQNDYFIPWFNTGFFDKWHIYDKLRLIPAVKKYLPETILHPSIEDIEKLLTQYSHIYIKPANGSLGLGIYQIIKRKNDSRMYCRYRTEHQNMIHRYDSIHELVAAHFSEGKLATMIAQQGITLMRMSKRPLDFRVHANKNREGQWQISALAAKISGHNSVTTHIASGGKIKTMTELAAENASFTPLIEQLQRVALIFSETFDQTIPGWNGEIGFDLGIDVHGEIWMFEANSKPGRGIFAHPKLNKEEVATRQLPFEYGVYLAETALTKPGLLLN